MPRETVEMSTIKEFPRTFFDCETSPAMMNCDTCMRTFERDDDEVRHDALFAFAHLVFIIRRTAASMFKLRVSISAARQAVWTLQVDHQTRQ